MLKLNAYQLKLIAIVGMVLSHASFMFRDQLLPWVVLTLYAVGGITYPIMAYFVVEGYKHTSNLKKYLLRLFIFGAIAIPFHRFVINLPELNIMFSIILGITILLLYDKIKYRWLFWVTYILVIVPISFLFFEYYFVGTTMVLLYYIIKNERARRIVPPVVGGMFWIMIALAGIASLNALEAAGTLEAFQATNGWHMNVTFMQSVLAFGAVTMLIVPLLLSTFNGERGRKNKWLFYVAYPLHLAILAGLYWIFFM